MAGEQKRRRRAMWVTKAMLLGYTIEENWDALHNKEFAYVLRAPSGFLVTHDRSYSAMRFPAQWVAAKHALVLSGVDLDENTSSP